MSDTASSDAFDGHFRSSADRLRKVYGQAAPQKAFDLMMDAARRNDSAEAKMWGTVRKILQS